MLTTADVLGVLLGLGAACFQAGSYVASRRFLTECRPSSAALFGTSHLQMGVLSLLVLPFLLKFPTPSPSVWLFPLCATAFSYLAGQWLVFEALKHSDSSKVAPLLGLKIPILAVATVTVLDQPIAPAAWVAVGLCTAASFAIAPPTHLPSRNALVLTSLGCIGYCLSDLNIPKLVLALRGHVRSEVFTGVALCYLLCALPGFIVSAQQKILLDRRTHFFALPHALCWFLAMCCLFGCFHFIGVIPGNMLQSTRGIISVLAGVYLSNLGLLHLENMTGRTTLVTRLVAATVMGASICMYFYVK